MSTFLRCSIVSLSATCFVFASAEKAVSQKSKIDQVTVYLDGATIARSAQVNLVNGVNEIVFSELSPDLVESSIQFSGLGDATVLSISFDINYLEKKAVSVEYAALETTLDKLLFRANEIQNTIDGYERELQLLTANQRINSDNTDLSLEKIKQISTYYRERSVAINNAIYTNKQLLKDLNQQQSDLRNEMLKLDDKKKERRGEITLKLQAERSANLKLAFTYNINNAGWFPFYDIKAKNTASPIEVAYKANVYQQSGVDWDNVKLILSTGDPNTNNLKPELDPKYLNFVSANYRRNRAVSRSNYKYNPTIRHVNGLVHDESGNPLPGVNVLEKGTSNGTQTDFDGKYQLPINGGRQLTFSYVGFSSESLPIYASVMKVELEEDKNSLDEVVVTGYGGNDVSRALQGKVAGVAVAAYNENVETKQEGLTNTRFEIKKKYTINSNADITTLEIDNFELPADYQYYAAPELNENVFLTATVREWEQYDLLQGEANIYFEGSYAGKTQINPTATSDSLNLSLGVDPNVVVKRERLNNLKSTSFFGGNRIVERGFSLEVKNNKSTAINLLLEDRVPITQNKEIKVDDIETGDAKYDENTGILKWKIKLEPKASAKKQFSYEVRFPKGRTINL